jgi:hypothetical protein
LRDAAEVEAWVERQKKRLIEAVRAMEKFAFGTGEEEVPIEGQINLKQSAERFWMPWKSSRSALVT